MKKLLFTLLLTLSLPLFVAAQTLSDLESKIAALLAQIQTLQTELQTLKSTEELQTPQASGLSSFTTTLGKGSEGADVTALQQYLAKDPALYPEGLVSGYYGALTEAAVKRFQAKHNIISSGTPATTGYGVLGPKTRATLNALLATTSSIPTPTPTTPTPTPTPPPVVGTTPNRSPNLSITGSRFVTLPNKVTLSAVATDDGLPSNTLTYFWSKASGPGTVTFSSLTTKDTIATFSSAGTYQITATVSDSDLFASYTIALIVSPASTQATSTPPATTTPTLPTPSLTFSASKTTLTKGTATTLTWSSTNAISCTASNGWSGSKTSSGSTTFTPETSTTYTLLCKGGGGDQVSKSVTVTVTGTAPEPIAGADLNGYVAEYECRKGNPNCDVDVEMLAKQSCDTIVYPSDPDWSKIEDHPEHDTYCITAGDHTDKNVLYLLFSGTSNNRKVLKYYDSADDGVHPVHQSSNERARLFAVQLKNSASYWLVHRLTFDAGGRDVNASVRFSWGDGNKGSSFNVFDRLLFQNDEAHFFQIGGQVKYGTGNPDNTIQNSVFRNPVISRQFEAQCINASGGPRLHIVNNEIYNCQKGIAIGDGVWTHEGLVIENNDVYAVPAEAYTDCEGNINGVGPCGITEDLISLKAGGTIQNPSRIFHNRLWGARNGDDNLGLTLNGSGGAIGLSNTGVSDGLQVQQGYYGGDYVRIDKNIIFDSGEGVSPSFPVADHISVIGNIFWKIKGKNWDWSFDTVTLDFGATDLAEIYFNTFIDSGVLHRFGWGKDHDTLCNQFINTEGVVDGDLRSGVIIAKNSFYNTPAFTTVSPSQDITRSSASESNNQEYCFYRKLLTSPERVCIPNAKTTTASPHYNQCATGAGQRSGIGINDKIWKWADTLFGQ